MDLTSKLEVKLQATGQNVLDLTTARDPFNKTYTNDLADGTGANQADQSWHDTRTLAAGANETLDLHGGSLSDAFGASVVFARLKAFFIKNQDDDNALIVGGAGSDEFDAPFGATGDKIKVRPGGSLLLLAPDATAFTVDATHKNLKLENDGAGTGSLQYDILLIGATA